VATALSSMALVMQGSGHPTLAIFCAAMAGSCIGFLVHNTHKARIFMGDTGSLALGAALAAIGVATNMLSPLLVCSAIFVAEAISVILQVGFFKATKGHGPDGKGKRLLRMAPLHHHLELGGWNEVRVTGTFYMWAWIAACCAVLVFKSFT